MKLTKLDIFNMHVAITKLLDNDDDNLDFKMMLVKNRSVIKNITTDMQDELDTQNKMLQKLAVKFCDKDENDKPITVTIEKTTTYKGLEYGKHEAYDKLSDDIQEKRKVLMKEKCDVDLKLIDMNMIPKNTNGLLLKDIEPLIKE